MPISHLNRMSAIAAVFAAGTVGPVQGTPDVGPGKRSRMFYPEPPLYRAGRNEPCPCGSGRKFKKCCLGKTAAKAAEAEAVSEGDLP